MGSISKYLPGNATLSRYCNALKLIVVGQSAEGVSGRGRENDGRGVSSVYGAVVEDNSCEISCDFGFLASSLEGELPNQGM